MLKDSFEVQLVGNYLIINLVIIYYVWMGMIYENAHLLFYKGWPENKGRFYFKKKSSTYYIEMILS